MSSLSVVSFVEPVFHTKFSPNKRPFLALSESGLYGHRLDSPKDGLYIEIVPYVFESAQTQRILQEFILTTKLDSELG